MTELEQGTQPSRRSSSRPPCAFDADEVPTTPWRVSLGAPTASAKAAPAPKRRPPPLPPRALQRPAAAEEPVVEAKLPSTFPKQAPTLHAPLPTPKAPQALHTPKPARTLAPEELPLVIVAPEDREAAAPVPAPAAVAAAIDDPPTAEPAPVTAPPPVIEPADDTASFSVRPSAPRRSWKLRIAVVAMAFAGEALLGGRRGALHATAVSLHLAAADVAPAVLAAPAPPVAAPTSAPALAPTPAPPPALMTTPAPALTTTPALAAAAASPEATAPGTTTPEVPPDHGILDTSAAPSGRRVFVDERTVGQTPLSPLVACGRHKVQIGSAGRAHLIDVPCGGTAHVAVP